MPTSRAHYAAAAFSLFAPFAMAETVIYVNKTDDRFDTTCTTNCSLREAIYRANQTPGVTLIVLRAATYTLSVPDPGWIQEEEPDPDENENVRGDLDIKGNLVIVGAGQAQTIIKGTAERLIDVLEGASLQVRRLTLRDGLSDTYGGAIRNRGTVLTQQVSFLENRADAGIQGQGGAIANYGTLTVTQALFENNNSNGDEGFFGRGGAIFNMGNAVVRDTTFRGNSATDDDSDYGQGGAVYNEGVADIARSTFVANLAGVPRYGGGGSAIANRESGVLTLTNSTISGNIGIETNGVLANGIDNFADDTAAQARLVNVTIAGNSGLGLSNVGSLVVRNSLIAGNSLDGMPANCSTSGSYQARGLLLGTDQGNCASDVPVDDALTWSKVLYPLADNAGKTWTHALRRGSPAIDAGVGSCTTIDQRGVSRPRDGDGDGTAVCDLGAYERIRP